MITKAFHADQASKIRSTSNHLSGASKKCVELRMRLLQYLNWQQRIMS